MRWLAVALVCSAAFAAEGEWEVLFDGRDTSKWNGGVGKPFPSGTWLVEDGWLKSTLPGPSLYSVQPFGDFELEFDWKIPPGANTGVKYVARPGTVHPQIGLLWHPTAKVYAGLAALCLLIAFLRRRSRLVRAAGIGAATVLFGYGTVKVWGIYRDGGNHPPGLEYQIIDNGISSAGMPLGSQRTASLYDLLPARNADPKPVGEVNSSRIVVRQGNVEHWLNGTPVLSYRLGSPELLDAIQKSKFRDVPGYGQPGEGLLELQNHGTEAYFRNIRIRKLTP